MQYFAFLHTNSRNLSRIAHCCRTVWPTLAEHLRFSASTSQLQWARSRSSQSCMSYDRCQDIWRGRLLDHHLLRHCRVHCYVDKGHILQLGGNLERETEVIPKWKEPGLRVESTLAHWPVVLSVSTQFCSTSMVTSRLTFQSNCGSELFRDHCFGHALRFIHLSCDPHRTHGRLTKCNGMQGV